MRSSLVAVATLVLVLGMTGEAVAATRYVAKTGSDSSDCTNSAAPCATVNYAVFVAGEGDTVQIGPGTFTGTVITEKILTFAGAGGGSLPAGSATTVLQGPAGGSNQTGKTALELPRGGTVRALRAIGGTGGATVDFGEPGGSGIEYDSNTPTATSLTLQDVVAIGAPGGPGPQIQGPGGKGLDVRGGPGPVTVTATGSDFAGGYGFAAGSAAVIYGPDATATITDARIENEGVNGTGVVVGGDARVLLEGVDSRSTGEAAGIYDGLLTIRRSQLHSDGWGLFVYPSSAESPELELIDSLVVSDESEALFLESDSESPAVARILGSTLVAHGSSDAVSARQEPGEGPATVTLRNSIVRHLPSDAKVPPVDFYANEGTVVAEFSNFNTRLEENGGTVTPPSGGGNVAGDPQFVDPAQEIFILKNDSPLIDRGDAGVVQPGELDLLGSPRSLDGNRDCIAAPDLGAYEVTNQGIPCPDPPPVISKFGMTNKVFAVGGKAKKSSASAAASKKVKHGTRFTYTLSEPARVTIAIDRKAHGRRAGKKCVKVTAAKRGAKPCTRFVHQGKLSTQEESGRQSLKWGGRLGGKALSPGRYRARAVAKDASGQRSKPKSVSFKVVAG